MHIVIMYFRSVFIARFVYTMSVVHFTFGWATNRGTEALIDALLMVWMLIAQPQNVTILFFSLLMETLIRQSLDNKPTVTKALLYHLLGWCAYFHMVL